MLTRHFVIGLALAAVALIATTLILSPSMVLVGSQLPTTGTPTGNPTLGVLEHHDKARSGRRLPVGPSAPTPTAPSAKPTTSPRGPATASATPSRSAPERHRLGQADGARDSEGL